METEYIHYLLGEEIEAAAGRYVVQKEAILAIAGRDVLYLLAFATVDSSCCSVGGMGYVVVPGYLVKWKQKTNQNGLAISIVEPIRDPAAREDIAGQIRKVEKIDQVNFL